MLQREIPEIAHVKIEIEQTVFGCMEAVWG
jgi:hypothetical protein